MSTCLENDDKNAHKILVRFLEDGITDDKNGHFEDAHGRGWAWFVCAAAFINLCFVGGIQYGFGVVLVSLRAEFKESQSNTAWVGSISVFSWLFFSNMAGFLCNRLNCRIVTVIGGTAISLGLLLSSFATTLWVLYITFGLLVGIGTSFIFLSSLLSVGHNFSTRRSLATGLAITGCNVGTFGLSLVQRQFIWNYGWRNNFRFMSAFSLIIIFCGFVFRPLSDDNNTNKHQEIRIDKPKTNVWNLCTNVKFLLYITAITVGCLGYLIPYYSLMSFARELGASIDESTLLLTFIAVGSCVGKMVFGILGDHTGKHITILRIYQSCMLLSGISSMLVILAPNYQSLVIYAMFYGLTDGGIIGLMSIGTFECVPPEYMSQGFACVLMMQSWTILIGPPIAGIIEDHFGETRVMFYLAGVPMLVGSFILSLHYFASDKHSFSGMKYIISLQEAEEILITTERLTVL